MQMERQRDREMGGFFFFSFILEIYNLYFNIFQNIYVVLLMNLSSINFDFSIFQDNYIVLLINLSSINFDFSIFQ